MDRLNSRCLLEKLSWLYNPVTQPDGSHRNEQRPTMRISGVSVQYSNITVARDARHDCAARPLSTHMRPLQALDAARCSNRRERHVPPMWRACTCRNRLVQRRVPAKALGAVGPRCCCRNARHTHRIAPPQHVFNVFASVFRVG